MRRPLGSAEYDADSNEPADPMAIAPVGSDDYDLGEHGDELESEYGEVEDTDKPSLPKGFYRKSVRRQNCFFGISLVHIVAAFLGAYVLMGMSFTRSNIAIFGDEVSMEGSSGEVGIDASNAEVQEIVDEEITELEEAGNWGDNAKRTEPNERFNDLIKNRNKVGLNSWTEKKQWWAEHKDDLDPSKMNKKEKMVANRFKKKEAAQKKKEERQKRIQNRKNNKGKDKGRGRNKGKGAATSDETDLDTLLDKIGKHYNFTQAHPGRPGRNKHSVSGPHKGGRGKNPQRTNNRAKANKDNASNTGGNE